MSIKQLDMKRTMLWDRIEAITQDEVIFDTIAELIEVELEMEELSNQ